MGDDAQQLGPRGIERRELREPSLDLGGQPALLDDPGQQRGDRLQERDLVFAEDPRSARLDIQHADDLAVPHERHRQHPGELLDIEAADPREARIDGDVLDGDRGARRSHAARDALTPGKADPADL